MKRNWTAWALTLLPVAILVLLSVSLRADSQDNVAADGWQALTDTTHGYRVSYPAEWKLQTVFENAAGEPYLIRRRLTLFDSREPQIEIDVWQREAATPMDRWFREVENITTAVESNATIAGKDAYVLVQSGGCGVPPTFSAYIPSGQWVYKLQFRHEGDIRSLDQYEKVLKSFSLSPAPADAQRQTVLPNLQSMLPLTCDVNICPSTCWSGCTFASSSESCCGYHPIPKWNCSKQCVGEQRDQIGPDSGNCVWWGAYTRPDVGALASGNADNWAISVRNTGQLPIDTTPKVGDIVVHPGSSYNHVAYVVWVSSDGTEYEMSDMGWCSDCGPTPEETKLRTVDDDDEFIHCKGDPAPPELDWHFADCPFGWTPSKGFSASGLSGLDWNLNPDQDPFLLSPVLSFIAEGYDHLEITMASNGENTNGKVYFVTESNPVLSEDKSVPFVTTSDGISRTYVLDMSANPHWQGTVTRFRVDPVESGNSDGSYDDLQIMRIRFVGSEPTVFEHGIYLPVVLLGQTTNRPPVVPSDPSPAEGAADQAVSLTLSWSGGDPDGDMVSYDIYLDADDSTPETLVCDGVSSTACDPGLLITGTHYYWQVVATDEHSTVTAGPIWEFTTSTAYCLEGIVNGDFETASDWEIPSTAYPAAYSTEQAHDGDFSMRVGIVDPADDVYSYSSARQLIDLPEGASSATLRYWLYTVSDEPIGAAAPDFSQVFQEEAPLASDSQYVLILDENDVKLRELLRERRDDRSWTYHEANLLDYADEPFKLYFGVYNDAEDGPTGMYVDDVSLTVCWP